MFIPIFTSMHFYFVHRFLHWPPLYRIAHALHHRNANVGPWSGLSMHPIEHVLYLSSTLIHLVLASSPKNIRRMSLSMPTTWKPRADRNRTVSDPIKSPFGWHLVRVDERRMRPVPALAEVQGEIFGEMTEAVQTEALDSLRESATIVRFEADIPASAVRRDDLIED